MTISYIPLTFGLGWVCVIWPTSMCFMIMFLCHKSISTQNCICTRCFLQRSNVHSRVFFFCHVGLSTIYWILDLPEQLMNFSDNHDWHILRWNYPHNWVSGNIYLFYIIKFEEKKPHNTLEAILFNDFFYLFDNWKYNTPIIPPEWNPVIIIV